MYARMSGAELGRLFLTPYTSAAFVLSRPSEEMAHILRYEGPEILSLEEMAPIVAALKRHAQHLAATLGADTPITHE